MELIDKIVLTNDDNVKIYAKFIISVSHKNDPHV